MHARHIEEFISVIIPTYHDWQRLELCLKALEKQTYSQDAFEIIVVNNDPADEPPMSLETPKNCLILEEAKPGSYAARNRAISRAKGSIYAFTDSDCQPQEDWLEIGEKILRENNNVSRVGGKISLIMKDKKPTISEVYEMAYAFRQEEFVKSKGMAATGNMLARKSVFDSIGDFNDEMMSGGDSEWGKRAQREGFSIVYSKNCIVWHPTRSRLQDIVQKTKREMGGHYVMRYQGSHLRKFSGIALGFLPPVKSMSAVLKNRTLTPKQKAIAILFRYFLRLVSTVELMKITLGLKKAERV